MWRGDAIAKMPGRVRSDPGGGKDHAHRPAGIHGVGE